MDSVVGFFDVLAMLGMFIVAFFMWVAWELITGKKVLAPLLAIGTFIVTWLVAEFAGADSSAQFFAVEAIVAAVMFRVANSRRGGDAS